MPSSRKDDRSSTESLTGLANSLTPKQGHTSYPGPLSSPNSADTKPKSRIPANSKPLHINDMSSMFRTLDLRPMLSLSPSEEVHHEALGLVDQSLLGSARASLKNNSFTDGRDEVKEFENESCFGSKDFLLRNSINLGAPLTSMAPNFDTSRVAVAGREVLKVISLSRSKPEEILNLRVGYRLNLNFSSTSVSWGTGYSQDRIATAATNGTVVLWDLNKTGQKIERLITEHARAVNKVIFSPRNGYLLFSGSQDGTVKLWDIRTKDPAKLTLSPKSEAVRDFQFNPMNVDELSCAFESGSVQIWDLRNPGGYTKKLTAHTGMALCVDYGMDGRTVASGGRDKLIKIWDTKSDSRKPTSVIQTTASISSLQFRPNHPRQLASISLNVDNAIQVYDLIRPHLPRYTLLGHSHSPTAIHWNSSDQLWSCGKDQLFIRRGLNDLSYEPIEMMISNGVSFNGVGDLAFLFEVSNDRGDKIRRQLSDQAFRMMPNQTSGILHLPTFDYFTFHQFAHNYRIDTSNLMGSTEHNYWVALGLKHFRVAQTWKMVQLIYVQLMGDEVFSSDEEGEDGPRFLNAINGEKEEDTPITVMSPEGLEQEIDLRPSMPSSSLTLSNGLISTARPLPRSKPSSLNGNGVDDALERDYLLDAVNLIDQIEDDDDDDLSEPLRSRNRTLSNPASTLSPNTNTNPNTSTHTPAGYGTPRTRNATSTTIRTNPSIPSESNQTPIFPSPGTSGKLLCEVIDHYLTLGDTQLASVLVTLFEPYLPLSDSRKQAIQLAYIDLLTRFKLYNPILELSQASKFEPIRSINLDSTTIHLGCGICKRAISAPNSSCSKCVTNPITCSVCRKPVKGNFLWCQPCGHGGHSECLEEWFTMDQSGRFKGLCPTGCGHRCNV